MLYAPDSEVNIFGNGTWQGPIVGGSIYIQGNATFKEDAGFKAQGLPGDTLYSRQSYIECSGTVVSVPNENC
jgi:hypothetical protein